jgi:metal-dependent amidase/aminoacylase/carboxypeptidase family protein
LCLLEILNNLHRISTLLLLTLQVVSVTLLKGGEAYNVIPESVTIGGTFRSLTDQGLSYLMKRVKEVNKVYIFSFSNSVPCRLIDKRQQPDDGACFVFGRS